MKNVVRFSKHRMMVALIALLILAVFAGFILWVYISESSSDSGVRDGGQTTSTTVPTREPDEGIPRMYVDGKLYTENTALETVLFLGIDKFAEDAQGSYINNQQSDTIVLAVFDHENKRVSLLPINRDTMTQISTYGVDGTYLGKETAQIALAHAYGNGWENSCKNAMEAVSYLLYNVEIDHYVSLKMDAVPYLNDTVGGVEVTLTEDFPMLGEDFVNGAVVTLQGEQALTYIRGRAGLEEATNVSRMQRQNQYMRAWSERFVEVLDEDDSFLLGMLYEISPYYFSDLSEDHMNDLAHNIKSYEQNDVLNIQGESRKGDTYMEFHVDEEALRDLVLNLFYQPAE